MMTAEQIRIAVLNHQRPPRTHGGKVRDALAHVSYSQNVESSRMASAGAFVKSVEIRDEHGHDNCSSKQ